MTKILKKHANQSFLLLLIGMVIYCSLSAENISLEQYQQLHQNNSLTFKSTDFSNKAFRPSQSVSSKFVMGDEPKPNPMLGNNQSLNNSHIDHQIFASPTNIKSAKRLFI